MGSGEFVGYNARLRTFMACGNDDETEFNRLALELFAVQFERVTIYREFCLSRKVKPENLARWQDVPALPTEAFKEFEVTSLEASEREAVFYSSGTTAEDRSRHFHSAESLRLYEDSLRPWFQRHFLADGMEMSLILLTPSQEDAPNSSLAHMFDTVAKSFPWAAAEVAGRVSADGAWEVDAERAMHILREAKKPVAMLGTAFSFVHLLDANPKERLRLPPGSRALETGGYKGRSRALPKSELHGLIRERLGIDLTHIVTEYGMSELSSQAYDRVAGSVGGGFQFPPWARIDVVSPETGRMAAEGESGMLRVYDLANTRSVFALQTADLAVRRGTDFELLGRAEAATLRGCSLMSA